MTKEEKLEEAKRLYKIANTDQKYVLERLFPEFAESEDERIREDLIQWINEFPDTIWRGYYKKDIIAWLEKQCGQKTTAWTPMDEQRVENLLAIIEGHGYPGEVAWLNSLKDRVQSKQGEQKKPIWSEENEEMYKKVETAIDSYYAPFSRDAEEMSEWFENLKDRVQPQPKQEWREEDEKLYNDLSDTYFYNDEDYPEETYKRMLKRVLTWMNKRAKYLRPQSTWKPSEEQINALYDVLNPSDGVDKKALESLYEQLKKL